MQVNTQSTSLTGAAGLPGGARQGGPPGRRSAASSDVEKAAALRRMKLLALSLLVVMAVIFVIAFALQKQYPWLGYVRAAAEAGMVGALADWFAVTALFRRPHGHPIPHTAIIPTPQGRDRRLAGRNSWRPTSSPSRWSGRSWRPLTFAKAGAGCPAPAARTGSPPRVPPSSAASFKVLNDDEVQAVIESMARKHRSSPPWGPPLGRLAERMFDDGATTMRWWT